ncbi:MAG: hypothetical protein JNL72_12955 [Flavipsychrobacter sp.]|nr:hypothetical protein [Flavipsychrobacter sp.]
MILNKGGELRFSTDTLTFDTVFTAQGSFTTSFKIYNPQSQRVKVSKVRLANGASSFFTLNVDGFKGREVSDIEIAPNDSIFVFATVNIDPTNENNPFVVEDKVVATLNGNDYELPLIAYGQNAYYISEPDGDSILQTQSWLTDKPYIVIGVAQVAKGHTLTIPAGCRIYMHANAMLAVSGTLKVNGTKSDSVIFQGDRLDRAYFGYEGYPGEWGGIYFLPGSQGNVMDWAILRNCGNGIATGLPAAIYAASGDSGAAEVTLKHIIVENSIGYGLLFFTANVRAENCLVHTTGAQALAIFQGGRYNFVNCDFINYGTNKVSHIENPTVAVLNYLKVGENSFVVGDLDSANFINCVIWGSLENELVLDKLDAAQYKATFDHCIIRKNNEKDPIPNYVTLVSTTTNNDPLFKDYTKWDYRPAQGSPLIDQGKTIINAGNDLDDKPWAIPFDIGCYQY